MITWKEKLGDAVRPDLAREIDVFETQIELKKQGKIDDRLFSETRLRRGTYGQRYDNGQRHDGNATRRLDYPSDLTKGPDTMWDAPGMQRIKIPFGGLDTAQMEMLADLAEEYSDGICHVTTRQDIQLHFVHIEDTPSLMRRLAAVGITTREACGNSVRNVTACPLAGVCRDETFDVTEHARVTSAFLLGHPDTQDFGRKFKIAFSGCSQHACALVALHDLGFIAKTRSENGQLRRGFEVYVGGGLGAVPYRAKLLEEFVPEEEILPLSQAISRVFARLGEKRNRARARLKFLVNNLGLEEFKRLVEEERRALLQDARWTDWIEQASETEEIPLKSAESLNGAAVSPEFQAWRRTNVYAQRQPGYVVVTVTLPMGDITSRQMRALAEVARRYSGDHVRTTVEQNIVLRWVSESDLPRLWAELRDIRLGSPGAGTIVDVVACPGTDTCKLGIASSRGLASELSSRLASKQHELDEGIRSLHIKISGCFNSCGQHHVCDLGFYGVSRKVGGTTVPHFQVLLGGKWEENAGAYGLAMGAIPSKSVPDFVSAITQRYLDERSAGETFHEWVVRTGKKSLKAVIDEFARVPAYDEDRSFYSDWRDPREFTVGDMGVGECAGEVVARIDFDLQEAERKVFEAQVLLEEGKFEHADKAAYAAMLEAARGLIRLQYRDVPDDPSIIVEEFRKRFYDTQLFWDNYAGGKFAQYFLQRHADTARKYTEEAAHHVVEEAQLFIEAAHACNARMLESPPATVVGVVPTA